jgi:hypothetical protein
MTRTRKVSAVVLGCVVAFCADGGAAEILAWDLNRPVTTADNGFPWSYSPPENYNWTTPIDYAHGTVHYRMEIRSCAGSGQDVCIQMCYHQDNLSRESCSSGRSFRTFTAGSQEPVVITWSEALSSWWQYSSIDWTRARQRIMLAIKKGTSTGGTPISNICCGWNWAGLDPNQIYPIDMRWTAVVVAPGSTFSGWGTYVEETGSREAPGSAQGRAFELRVRSGAVRVAGADSWTVTDMRGRLLTGSASGTRVALSAGVWLIDITASGREYRTTVLVP